jgi:hypothetical protein
MDDWIEKLAANLKRAHELATDVVFVVQTHDGQKYEHRILFDPQTGEEFVAMRHGGIVATSCLERSYPDCVIHREWRPR